MIAEATIDMLTAGCTVTVLSKVKKKQTNSDNQIWSKCTLFVLCIKKISLKIKCLKILSIETERP